MGVNAIVRRIAFLFFLLGWLLYPIPSHSAPLTHCAQQLFQLLPGILDQIAKDRPENFTPLRAFLETQESEIARRILEECPNQDQCGFEQLNKVALRITREALQGYRGEKRSWLNHALTTFSLGTYVAISVWVTTHTDSVAAASASATLSIIGTLFIASSGASSIEIFLAKLRQTSYWLAGGTCSKMNEDAVQRFGRLYHRTQTALASTEEEARDTERHTIGQVAINLKGLEPKLGESRATFESRAAELFALTLSDVVPKYGDIDFADDDHSGWARHFAKWNLDPANRAVFQRQVLHFLQHQYDKENAQPGTDEWKKYERVLRSWLKPAPLLPPLEEAEITSPPDSHQ